MELFLDVVEFFGQIAGMVIDVISVYVLIRYWRGCITMIGFAYGAIKASDKKAREQRSNRP